MSHQQTNPPKKPLLDSPEGDILIVDDTTANLRLLSRMLVKQGYKVRAAASGVWALKAVQASPPDLILLDIMMPDMDGYEVCQQLKAGEQTRDIPIIFISALNTEKDKVKAFTAGGVDYVTKPFQVAEVLARVKTHLTLQILQKKFQQKNAELDAIAHTVSHDLKNPLAVLVGQSSMLKYGYAQMSDEEIYQYLAEIEQEGLQMSNIVDELLLLASVRQMEEIETRALDMGRIMAEVQERLAYLIEEHQANIIWPDNWPVAVGYGQWIQEVWVNYISNALKYGGRPPRIELGSDTMDHSMDYRSLPAGRYIRFWVRDNGPGLSPEEHARLFTPFERLQQTRAKGHGLGLSIVRRIVEKLGGQAGAESKIGEGSTFYFTLPGERR